MTDLLQPFRDAYDQAADGYVRARRALDAAHRDYASARRYGSADELTTSRAAWGDALHAWAGALYDREVARDAFTAARREQAAAEAEAPL